MADSKFNKLIEVQEKLQKTIQYLTEKDEARLIEWDIALEKTRLLYETLTDIKLAVLSRGTEQELFVKESKEDVTESQKERQEVQKEEQEKIQEVQEEQNKQEEIFVEESIENLEIKEEEQKSKEQIKVQEENEEATKSLNDILVDIQNNMDLATKLQNLPIETLEEAISLNDKIWFVRELFAGDNDLYNKVIQDINKADSIKEAIKIVHQLSWDKDNSATKTFFELMYRKFIR